MFNRVARSSIIAWQQGTPKVSRYASLQARNTFLLQLKRENSTLTSVYTDKTYAPFAHYVQYVPPDVMSREELVPARARGSQAVKAHGQIWLSGQIPADAQGNLVTGSIAEKTRVIIQNTEALLKEGGSGLDKAVKVVVYVTDASIMAEFSKVYDPAFPCKPARSMVEVSKLPAGVDIQVDFIAIV